MRDYLVSSEEDGVVSSGFEALVACDSGLFFVDSARSVTLVEPGYFYAIGSGAPIALGFLESAFPVESDVIIAEALPILKNAIQAAAKYDNSVGNNVDWAVNRDWTLLPKEPTLLAPGAKSRKRPHKS